MFATRLKIGTGLFDFPRFQQRLPGPLLCLKESEVCKVCGLTEYRWWHIRQLEALSEITMEKVFKDYAEYFAVSLKAVRSNLWWQDMLKEIQDARGKR